VAAFGELKNFKIAVVSMVNKVQTMLKQFLHLGYHANVRYFEFDQHAKSFHTLL
jgi:hypothetical protein